MWKWTNLESCDVSRKRACNFYDNLCALWRGHTREPNAQHSIFTKINRELGTETWCNISLDWTAYLCVLEGISVLLHRDLLTRKVRTSEQKRKSPTHKRNIAVLTLSHFIFEHQASAKDYSTTIVIHTGVFLRDCTCNIDVFVDAHFFSKRGVDVD